MTPRVPISSAVVVLGFLSTGCLGNHPPIASKPPVAEDRAPVDPVARQLAPQAFARMEVLEREANRAYQQGDADHAAIVGEAVIAARHHARVLSQLAQSEARRRAASSALEADRRSLQAALGVLQSLEARAVALEGQLLVEKSLQQSPESLWPEELAGPVLETLMLQARMLCLSVQLLGYDQEAQALSSRLEALEGAKGDTSVQERITQAADIKSRCLNALTARGDSRFESGASVRKPHELTGADRLLTRLSSAGFQPVRDERGVVVSIPLQANERPTPSRPAPSAKQLAQVAVQEPGCRALVVGHAGTEGQGPLVDREVERVRKLLLQGGIGRVEVFNAGVRQPLVPPMLNGATRFNGRLEVVFLSSNW